MLDFFQKNRESQAEELDSSAGSDGELVEWIKVHPVKIRWTETKLSFLSLREVHNY